MPAYKGGGWFAWAWQAAGLWGQYDMRVLRLDASGNVTARMFTQVNLTGTPSASALVPYSEPDIVLGGQPANATTLTFKYRVNGSAGAFITTSFTSRGSGQFGRNFQNDNLLPVVVPGSVYDYEYQYEARDAGGQIVNSATGVFRVTPNAKSFLSHTSTRLPTLVPFTIDDANALYMDILYRPKGSTGAYTAVPRLSRASNAVQFKWDASAITPATGSATFEYQYRLYDSAGNAVKNPLGQAIVVDGQATVGQVTSQAAVTGWVITGAASASNAIRRRQSHNAFGEVDSETDGRGYVTNSFYDTLGHLVLRQDPTTDITGENGVTTRARPETRYYYDRTGKAVGTRDANNNLTTQSWNDGLEQAQVAKVFYPDAGNVSVNSYDVYGNLRIAQDGEGRQSRYSYDLKNQLIRLDRPTRGTGQYLAGQASYELYEYDSAGHRIATTSVLGRARTYYDLEGRVIKVTSMEGRDTGYAYTYLNTIVGAGGAQVGGWQKTTTMIGAKVAYERHDVFGRMSWRQDYGGHAFTFSYNGAGWLTAQTSTLAGVAQQNLGYDYYANGYLKRQTDKVYNTQADYTYDDNGNRVFEGYKRNGVGGTVYANSTVVYDELNRVKSASDPKYQISYKYDAVGNRRNVYSYYNDGLEGDKQTQDLWYLYDSLNRFTVTMGQLSGGVISRGTTGKLVSYNRANERMSADYYDAASGKTLRERYTYTSDGYLQDMYLSTWNGSAFAEQSQAAASRSTDLAGRVTNYVERNADNSIRANLTRTFDRDNRQLSEVDYTQLYNGAAKTDSYGYNADGTLGQIVTTNVQTGTTRSFAYQWWDSAWQTELKVQANGGPQGWAAGTSKLSYDLNGNLYRATDVAGKRTMQYVTDGDGQILYRQELAARTSMPSDWDGANLEAVAGDAARKRSFYYLNGQRIGEVQNEGGTPSQTDYAASLAQAKNVSNDERNKKFTPTAYANFDENYQPINEAYPGTAATDYTVADGDTLGSIAARIWGDRAMWYLIADANGLGGGEKLTAGMRLVIPNKVANIHNNAGTFKVYDAGEAIGDVSPTLPPPPPPPQSDKGCGGIGTIIMIVIAVVVTIYTAGAAAGASGAFAGTTAGTAATTAAASATAAGAGTFASTMAAGAAAMGAGGMSAFAAGALGAAAGSIASQGVGIAIGAQERFSWKGVGLSALSGGLSSGLPAGLAGTTAGTWQNAAVRAGIGNTLTQGIGVATGLQPSFDWRGVAASAVGAGVGQAVGGAMGMNDPGFKSLSFGEQFGARLVTGLAAGAATAVARGGRVAVQQIATDAFGSAIGNGLAEASSGINNPSSANYVNEMDRASDSYNPATEYGYRNGMDLQSDQAYDVRHSLGGPAPRDAAFYSDFGDRERSTGRRVVTDMDQNFGAIGALGPDDVLALGRGGGRYLPQTTDGPGARTVTESQQELERINEMLRETRGGLSRAALYNDLATGAFRDFDTGGQRNILAAMDSYANTLNGNALLAVGHEARGADTAMRVAVDWAKQAGTIPEKAWYESMFRQGREVSMGLMASGLMKRLDQEGAPVARPRVVQDQMELAPHVQAEAKGYKGVKVTENGGPTFADTEYLYPVQPGQRNVVEVTMTGSRRLDFEQANKLANLAEVVPTGFNAPKGYVWHHVDNFDPFTGRSTLELIRFDAHTATFPHTGSVRQYESYYRTKYR